MDCRKELELLLEKYGKEKESDTPEFILADHLIWCLNNFNHTVLLREQWHGRSASNRGRRTRPPYEGRGIDDNGVVRREFSR